MGTLLAHLWARYKPCGRAETPQAWMTRRYPHLTPPVPWTDGTD